MLAYGLICLGILLGQIYHFFNTLNIALIFCICLCVALLLIKPTAKTENFWVKLIGYLLLLALCVCYSNSRFLYRQTKQLAQPITNLAITAYLTSPIKTNNGYNQTTLQISQGKFAGYNILLMYPESYQITAGYNYQFNLALKPLLGSKNQDAFDFEQAMVNKDISASGFALSQPIKLHKNYNLASQITALRISVINNLTTKLADIKYKGFLLL